MHFHHFHLLLTTDSTLLRLRRMSWSTHLDSLGGCIYVMTIMPPHLFVQLGFSLAAKAAMPIFWS